MKILARSDITIININDGVQGEQGQQGVSIVSEKEQFYLSSSKTSLSDGEWLYTEPDEIPENQYLFGRIEFTMSDGTVQYSDAVHKSVLSGLIDLANDTKKIITTKIWETDIETILTEGTGGSSTSIVARISNAEQTLSGFTQTVSDVQTAMESKADGSEVQTLSQNVSTLQQDLNGFKLSVEETYVTDSKLETEKDSILSITSDNISTAVSNGKNLITSINQTAEEIQIDASKINLNGQVTYNMFSEETQDALTSIGGELIIGTQEVSTSAWTGRSLSMNQLSSGTKISYKLPQESKDTPVTLNLTLRDGETQTGDVPVYFVNEQRLTKEYSVNSVIQLVYDGIAWRVINPYINSNTYDRIRYQKSITAGTDITGGNIIVAKSDGSGEYQHLNSGESFDLAYPILYASASIMHGESGSNNYIIIPFEMTTTQSGMYVSQKPVFIKGTLVGTTFTPISTTPLTQDVPSNNDGYYYIYLGMTYDNTSMYLLNEHSIYKYYDGAFKTTTQIAADAVLNTDLLTEKTSPSLSMKINHTSFNTEGNGTAYLHGYEDGIPADVNGYVYWNAIRREVPKTLLNPNGVCPRFKNIYIVLRLTSIDSSTGTLYFVWWDTYTSKWTYSRTSFSSKTEGEWTWREELDVVLGQIVKSASNTGTQDIETNDTDTLLTVAKDGNNFTCSVTIDNEDVNIFMSSPSTEPSAETQNTDSLLTVTKDGNDSTCSVTIDNEDVNIFSSTSSNMGTQDTDGLLTVTKDGNDSTCSVTIDNEDVNIFTSSPSAKPQDTDGLLTVTKDGNDSTCSVTIDNEDVNIFTSSPSAEPSAETQNTDSLLIVTKDGNDSTCSVTIDNNDVNLSASTSSNMGAQDTGGLLAVTKNGDISTCIVTIDNKDVNLFVDSSASSSTSIIIGDGPLIDSYLYVPPRSASNILTSGENAYGFSANAVQWVTENGPTQLNATEMLKVWTDGAISKETTINGGWIATNTITSKQLATDAIMSNNYVNSPNVNSPFSAIGTFLDLSNGNFWTPNFGVINTVPEGTSVPTGAWFNGNINADSGRIGSDTSYWNIESVYDYNMREHAALVGIGSPYIQTGNWQISDDAISTKKYTSTSEYSGKVSYYKNTATNTFYDMGMKIPTAFAKKTDSTQERYDRAVYYGRKYTGDTPPPLDSEWDYLFMIDSEGRAYFKDIVLKDNSGATLSGSLPITGGTITGDLTVDGTLTASLNPLTINGQLYNGSSAVTISTINVAYGGTGVNTLASGEVLIGNGTDGITTRAINNNETVGNIGWTKNSEGDTLVTTNSIANWNGAYKENKSNIEYVKQGKLGNIVTYNIEDLNLSGGGNSSSGSINIGDDGIARFDNGIQINNSTFTTGGVALYNDEISEYGIMLRYTEDQKKHGFVQGDVATYFTMNGTEENIYDRGWIFKNYVDYAGVFSISAEGNMALNGEIAIGTIGEDISGSCSLVMDRNLQCISFVFND